MVCICAPKQAMSREAQHQRTWQIRIRDWARKDQKKKAKGEKPEKEHLEEDERQEKTYVAGRKEREKAYAARFDDITRAIQKH